MNIFSFQMPESVVSPPVSLPVAMFIVCFLSLPRHTSGYRRASTSFCFSPPCKQQGEPRGVSLRLQVSAILSHTVHTRPLLFITAARLQASQPAPLTPLSLPPPHFISQCNNIRRRRVSLYSCWYTVIEFFFVYPLYIIPELFTYIFKVSWFDKHISQIS